MIRTDYEKNLSRYVQGASKDKLDQIKKFCGIALRGLDSQYVSMSDDAEIMRVANGFGAKKLDLTEAQTRAGLAKVDEIMREEKTKMRTTVYYLLARETGTLDKLKAPAAKKAKPVKKAKKAAKKSVKKAAKKPVKKAKAAKKAKPAKKAKSAKKTKKAKRK
jgi:hypothetical protein